MKASHHPGRRGGRGFTLVEVMISSVLCAVLTLAALTALVFTVQGEHSLANYSEMNEKARKMLEQFGRDMRSAGRVPAAGYSSTALQVLIPSDLTGTNWQAVTWSYNASAGTLSRTLGGGATVVYVANVETMNFKYFNNNGVAPSSEVDLKQVQLTMSIRRYLSGANSASVSEYVVSAQFTLRSKSTSV